MRRGKWSNLKYKHKIIIYLSLFLMAAVIAFSLYSYRNYMQQLTLSARDLSQTDAKQIAKRIDENLINLKRYYLANTTNDEVSYVLENDLKYYQYSYIKAAMDILAGNNVLSDYISGYTLVNFKTGWVLSHKGMYPFTSVLNQNLVNDLYNYNNTGIDKNYWHYDDESISLGVNDVNYRLYVDTSGLNLVMKLPAANLYVYGMIIININRGELHGWMTDGLAGSEDIIVTDDDGKIIYSSNPALNDALLSYRLEEPFVKKMKSSDGSLYVVTKSSSSIMNWHYYVANNWNEVTKETKNYSVSILLLIIAVLIIIAALIGYGIYMPINHLTRKATAGSQEREGFNGNELQFLADSFDYLVGNNAELEEKVLEQRSRVMELFELRLLRKELMPEGVDTFLEKLQLDSIGNFTTLAIIFRTSDEAQTLTGDHEDEIGNDIVNNMPEHLRKSLSLQPIYYARAVFCTVSEEDPEVMVHIVMDFFNELKKYVESTYGLHIGVGVSAVHSDIRQLNIAYQESIHALNSDIQSDTEHTQSAGYSYCRFYAEQTSKGKKVLESSYEKEIRTAIMGCDKEQAYNAVNLFIRYLKQEKLSHDDTVIYLVQFTNAILLAIMEFGLDTEHLFRESLSDIYMQMVGLYDLDKCRRYIKHVVIDPIMEAMDSLNSTQTHLIMEKVQQLIEEHKGNITLAECAEILNYHPTYIWKILKMEKNKSFANYLEEYKIEQAKRLLKETKLTIGEIAQQLNYTNAQNFIRFFSKAVGTTPGKYRNLL